MQLSTPTPDDATRNLLRRAYAEAQRKRFEQ